MSLVVATCNTLVARRPTAVAEIMEETSGSRNDTLLGVGLAVAQLCLALAAARALDLLILEVLLVLEVCQHLALRVVVYSCPRSTHHRPLT